MKKTTKRYIISAIITFLGGFLSVIVLKIDDLTLNSFKDGTLLGLIFVAVRTGIKAIAEWFLATFINK